MKRTSTLLVWIYCLMTTAALVWCAHQIISIRYADKVSFEELIVKQIRIVEPDGTLRMIFSNHDRFPGIIVKGVENEFERPQAGMLFFNDEGTENGGLIFSGYMDDEGKIRNSGGSLTFDRYGGNQEVQLIGVNDSEYAFTGLIVRESPPNEQGHRRIWLGKDNEKTASLALKDGMGRDRIVLEVDVSGKSSITFLDEAGRVLKTLEPTD